ncbi:hypothetical protein M2323_004519 [Rhodoblastus acidophilus]|uniref:virion core protein, T7 gp14 family n=1 Tax=Rhodoblastus acidophilus TaxID=1074 RepID=UPI00222518B1|nr:hypothetical protein [Rhodoblastus acidophilus]MCW2286633.1 hypothetical protein [Rhodoblastus acidophilus]MCW2335569.1 hypothetical protein [Rhodoblastus acidophilus]
MCTPLALGGLAIQAAGTLTNFATQAAANSAYNTAARKNALDASVAAAQAYGDEGKKYTYNMRELQQQGYKAVMQGRQAQGTAIASAGAAGFDGSSISVGSILAAEAQKTAMNLDNIKTKQEDQRNSYESTVSSIEAQAKGRANSMTPKAAPSALALGINLAGEGLEAAKSANYFST